jgi:putative lipoic acid-binding regulatory protein
MKRDIDYPAEITFKTVFSHQPDLYEAIENVLFDMGVAGNISSRDSRQGKFISYTVTAVFESESHLDEACGRISAITGFIMMF